MTVIDQKQKYIHAQELKYKELEKETEVQMQLLREDFTKQQNLLQDQYEFSLSELRYAYEVRMEKQVQDSENKVREALNEKDRTLRELDAVLKEKKKDLKDKETAELQAEQYLQ